MVNNHATEESLSDRLGGALSHGEFGSMLQQIFEPKSQASFAWLRWGTLRGQARARLYLHGPAAELRVDASCTNAATKS